MSQPRILHVIGSLETGGAERVLCNLLARMDPTRAEYRVVSLIPGGSLREPITQLGIPLRSAGMRRGVPNPVGLWRLIKLIGQDRPDLVVTWMYHANILGGIAAAACRVPVIWNIRDSGGTASHFKPATRLVSWAGRVCSSHLPRQIVFVSKTGREQHLREGYNIDRSVVIPNGFDTAVFRPSGEARRALRQALGAPENAILVGLLARVHPDKDHQNFVRAAGIVHPLMPHVQFLLCGEGASADNRDLTGWIRAAGLGHAVRLLGRRSDMPRIAASLDLLISASSSEAFPNVVGEAMSCGVPCVVTDVGDSAYLVGTTGRVVPRRDADRLAAEILKLLQLPQHRLSALGQSARRRICELFSIDTIAPQHEQLWLATAGRPSGQTVRERRRRAA